jgi:hypothetical protein
MTNKTVVPGSWNVQRVQLRQRFPILTVDDLLHEQGQKNEMLERVRIKLGKTDEEFIKIMEECNNPFQ